MSNGEQLKGYLVTISMRLFETLPPAVISRFKLSKFASDEQPLTWIPRKEMVEEFSVRQLDLSGIKNQEGFFLIFDESAIDHYLARYIGQLGANLERLLWEAACHSAWLAYRSQKELPRNITQGILTNMSVAEIWQSSIQFSVSISWEEIMSIAQQLLGMLENYRSRFILESSVAFRGSSISIPDGADWLVARQIETKLISVTATCIRSSLGEEAGLNFLSFCKSVSDARHATAFR